MREKVLVVGLGQAGNKIADLFGRNNYSAIGVNTAEEDMKNLQNIKKFTIGNHGGSGKDRKLAIEQLKEDFPKIFSEVREASTGKDIIVLCSSLGGGTGSGTVVATARNVALNLQKTVIVVGVLPVDIEGVNLKENAINAISELDKIKSDVNIMLVKNESDFNKVNTRIFRKVDALFHIDGKSETSFDRMDLLNSFKKGYLDIITGNGDEPTFTSNIYDLATAKAINFVAMTRKRIKGDLILSDYKALNKNFFEYKTSNTDSYFAIFSALNTPAELINKTKYEIEKLYQDIASTEEEQVDFTLNIPKREAVKETEKKQELDFIFDFS